MAPFQGLEKRYKTDPAFNKLVNVLRSLIEEHGFVPSEIREGLFFAQYIYEINRAEQIVRTQDDWAKIAEARLLMRMHFGLSMEDLEKIK